MLEQRKTLYAGLDLCNEYSQLYCYNEREEEPEAIEGEKGDPFIPTVLGVKKGSGEWFFGREARSLFAKGEAELLEGFLGKIERKEELLLCGTPYSSVQIMEKYLRRVLSLLNGYYPNEAIKRLTVTISSMNVLLIKAVYQALHKMGMGKDRVQIISHEQAYLYFALSQKKELWMNDIGLFDFDDKGLSFYRISINRNVQPMVVGVRGKDYSGTLSYEFLKEQGEQGAAAYVFENIAKSVLFKQIVSTLYLTGIGFEGEWFQEVARELCAGRRLFAGQNLYPGGACYASKKGILKDFIFLSPEMVPCSISVKAYYNAKIEEVILVRAGTPWYEADHKIYLIPDFEDELEITVRDVMRCTCSSYLLNLGEIKGRPNKTVRLEVRIYFTQADLCVLKVKDRGFGEAFPTSNRVWEKIIHIPAIA